MRARGRAILVALAVTLPSCASDPAAATASDGGVPAHDGASTPDGSDAGSRDAAQESGPGVGCPATRTKVAPLSASTLAFDSDRTGNHEIFVMQKDGSQVTELTKDSRYTCWWPRISPDRTTILFTCAPKGPEDYSKAGLWLMNVDGSERCELRTAGEDGWTITGHEEWSPDGTNIAIAGGVGLTAELFLLDASGKKPKQLTTYKSITTDVSWAPDGLTLLTNSCAVAGATCPTAQYEIFTLPAAGGVATRLTNDAVADYDPYYSPNQARIAWLRNTSPTANGGIGAWGIWVMDANGANPKAIIDDGQVNSKPAWSLDGATIYFHRLVFPATHGFSVWSIHPDGTGLQEITASQPGVNEFPTN
jgi:TolB protein